MSRSTADLRRRAAALSTNGRDFVPGIKLIDSPREHLNDEDDEDIRLEKYRGKQKGAKLEGLEKRESRGKRIVSVFEDSPNGYEITARAPPETERAVKFYSFNLRHFTAKDYPEEYGLIHYSLGKVFFADKKVSMVDYEDRAKYVENALHHLRISLDVYGYDSHPIMFGVICTFIGQLFRERATMITNRSILAKRGVTVTDSIRIGLAQVSEGMTSLAMSKFHVTEYALASLEMGWLYVMMLTEAAAEEGEAVADTERASAAASAGRGVKRNKRANNDRAAAAKEEAATVAREQAILYLDRVKSLVKQACDKNDPEGKPRGNSWTPGEKTTHPHHIKLLLRGESLSVVTGISHYLLGRCYADSEPTLHNQGMAFDHFCKAVKPGALPMEWEEWADSHHRAAGIAIKCPKVVDDDFGNDPMADSDLCYVSAATHLSLAQRCPSLRPGRKLDLMFHQAQAHIARLYMITDRVPVGKSTLVAIAQASGGEGMEIIASIKRCLIEAIQGSTAANMESTQDAYVYFFSCLKLSELRMLEAAAKESLSDEERDKLLEQSIMQLVNALLARSVADNTELHYIACSQMAGMLLASRRFYASTKCFGKSLLCLGALSNRIACMPLAVRGTAQQALWAELDRQTSQALQASAKEVKWVKKHLGAIFLTESVTRGFAYWSFEAHETTERSLSSGISKSAKSNASSSASSGAGAGAGGKGKELSFQEAVASRAPPTLLPAQPGAVPLWAFGHHPDFEGQDRLLQGLDEERARKGYFLGQRRRAIPHMPELIYKSVNIVTTNKKRDVVYLMPMPNLPSMRVGDVGAKVSFKIEGQHIDDYLRNKEKKAKLAKLNAARARERAKAKGAKAAGGGGGLLSRMFGGGRSKAAAPAPKKPSSTSDGDDDDDDIIPHLQAPGAQMFASIQGFYALMVLSRQSRTQLVHTAGRLQAFRGQRAHDCKNLLPSDVKIRLEGLLDDLKDECSRLLSPSFSLRHLSERSFDDLRFAFQSQVALCRVASDLEEILAAQVVRYDFFLPSVVAAQALTRDVAGFDKALLNAQQLIRNLRSAEALKQERKAKKEAQAVKSAALLAAEVDQKTFGESEAPVEAEEQSREEVEAEEEDAGLMTFDLSQVLDGAMQGGTPLALSDYIDENEVLLLWHVPAQPGQSLQLVLVWKERRADPEDEDSAQGGGTANQGSSFPSLHRNRKGKRRRQRRATSTSSLEIVVETCKTELDPVQLEYLVRNWLVALVARPEVRRVAHATDALRSLSCYLALTEVLLLLPRNIDSIVVCAPPILRIVPWHLIFVEVSAGWNSSSSSDEGNEGNEGSEGGRKQSSNPSLDPRLSAPRAFHASAKDIVQGRVVPSPSPTGPGDREHNHNLLDSEPHPGAADGRESIHLMEKFIVRLGPTLSLFELCERASSRLGHESGKHRMVAVDGEERDERHGLRSAMLECVAVTGLFSADPDDAKMLASTLASPKQITTATLKRKISQIEQDQKKRIREAKRKQRAEQRAAARKEAHDRSGVTNARYIPDEETDSDEVESISNDEMSSDDDEADSNRKALRRCRVLHLACKSTSEENEGVASAVKAQKSRAAAAAKVARTHGRQEDSSPQAMTFSGLKLPMYYDRNGDETKDRRSLLSSKDVVAQLHLTNCALCVASRFSLSDGVYREEAETGDRATDASLVRDACARNCELVDSLHLAGACTVMHPLWATATQGGIATLASVVFLLRFYAELPTCSQLKRSVCHAVRRTMQWMRSRTADETIAFVARLPINPSVKAEIIEGIEATIESSTREGERAEYAAYASDENGNKIRPGDRKFWQHFLSWGGMALSGTAGSVHPRDLTEEMEDTEDSSLQFDGDMNNVSMEISVLRAEGRFAEAKILERRLTKKRVEAVQISLEKARVATLTVAKKVKDAFEALDKAVLDQDSDEVSVDSDDNNGGSRQASRFGINKAALPSALSSAFDRGAKLGSMVSAGLSSTMASASSAAARGAAGGREGLSSSFPSLAGRLLDPSHKTPTIRGFLQQHAKYLSTPTPVSSLTSFVDGLFADGEERDEGPRRLIAVKEYDVHAQRKGGAEDDEDIKQGASRAIAQRRQQKQEEQEEEERVLSEQAQREQALRRQRQGRTEDMVDLLPESRACTVS